MTHNTHAIINFQPQPDFPAEDISEPNAAMAGYHLQAAAEAAAYRETHRSTLQVLNEVGTAALKYLDIAPGDRSAEYQAFCHGFTDIDYVATLVNARPYKTLVNGIGMHHFQLQHGDFADVELAKRATYWRQSHENTTMMLLEASERRRETQKQFTARLMGAQVASELLYMSDDNPSGQLSRLLTD